MAIICLFSLSGIASNSLVNSVQKNENQTKTQIKTFPFLVCCEVGFEVCEVPVCITICAETWQELSTKINEWRSVFEEVEC